MNFDFSVDVFGDENTAESRAPKAPKTMSRRKPVYEPEPPKESFGGWGDIDFSGQDKSDEEMERQERQARWADEEPVQDAWSEEPPEPEEPYHEDEASVWDSNETPPVPTKNIYRTAPESYEAPAEKEVSVWSKDYAQAEEAAYEEPYDYEERKPAPKKSKPKPTTPARDSEYESRKTVGAVLISILVLLGIFLTLEILCFAGVTSSIIPVDDIRRAFSGESQVRAYESEPMDYELPDSSTVVYDFEPSFESEREISEADLMVSESSFETTQNAFYYPAELEPYAYALKEVNAYYAVSTQGGQLNLREKPAVDGEVLDLMPFGYRLFVQYTFDDWAYVAYNGSAGWCALALLSAE